MPETIVLKVSGMTCGACVRHVTRALEGMRGVIHVAVDLKRGEAAVEHEPQHVDAMAMRAAIRDAGYDAAAGSGCCGAGPGS